jgi:hypothetical protein
VILNIFFIYLLASCTISFGNVYSGYLSIFKSEYLFYAVGLFESLICSKN